jgi:hypothetical protein
MAMLGYVSKERATQTHVFKFIIVTILKKPLEMSQDEE